MNAPPKLPPEPAAGAGLIIRGLGAGRSGRPVLAGVDLDLEPGTATILRGPNGAGKSTLLRAMAGLVRPTSGLIAVRGGNGGLRENIVYIGHADAVKTALTVRENIDCWKRMYGARTANPPEIAERMRLMNLLDQRAATLSAGQRRRLGFCRALVSGKPIWLLDEPTSGVDAGAVETIIREIETHTHLGGLVIIATHEPLALGNARTVFIEPAP